LNESAGRKLHNFIFIVIIAPVYLAGGSSVLIRFRNVPWQSILGPFPGCKEEVKGPSHECDVVHYSPEADPCLHKFEAPKSWHDGSPSVMQRHVYHLTVSSLKQEEWHSNQKEGEEVRDEEPKTSKRVAQERKPPNISIAHCVPDAR
jgi:hypothetical protein